MLRTYAARVVALCLTALVCTVALASEKEVKPTEVWAGKVADESLRKLASESGAITNAKAWNKLWSAWRPDEDVPAIDFDEQLVLVGTVSGPNLVIMQPAFDKQGDVRFAVGGTKVAGPGFGYKLVGMNRDGVKSVNGKPLGNEKPGSEDSITVKVVGTIHTGVVAIGGETTGTTITAGNITWELDFGENEKLRKRSDRLDGKKAIVKGTLEKRAGVEVEERWIVHVTSIKPAGKTR